MSTSAPEVNLNDPRFNIPQRILFIPPTPTTPYELRLAHHGLHKPASRAAVNRVIKKICNSAKQRMDTSDTWTVPLFTTMLRSDKYHAGELAKQQTVRYSYFRSLIKSQFTRFEIQLSIPFTTPNKILIERDDLRQIRETVDEVISCPKFNKLGTWTHPLLPGCLGVRLKFLVCNRVAEAVRDNLVKALSKFGIEEGISNFRVFDKENFAQELAAIVAPDLPEDGELRADFEFLLQGLAQISYSGLSAEEKVRFALTSPDNANLTAPDDMQEEIPVPELPVAPVEMGKIRLSHVPISPKTGLPARFISIPVDRDTDPEDLDPTEWLEIIPPS